jgi:predicted ATPase
MDQAIALARDLHHPETLAYALFFTAWLHQLRRESVETLKWAETTIAHATEHGLVQWAAFGKSLLGWAMAREGQSAEGIARMREALAVYQSIGSEISRPHFLALLAEALGQVGEPRQGLSVLAEALVLALTTGGRYYEAEIHQLRGDLMIMSDDRAMIEVEECYRLAAQTACSQSAKAFELRAAVRLCRLKTRESRQMLAEVYDWFTEGFTTPDLIDARAILEAPS